MEKTREQRRMEHYNPGPGSWIVSNDIDKSFMANMVMFMIMGKWGKVRVYHELINRQALDPSKQETYDNISKQLEERQSL